MLRYWLPAMQLQDSENIFCLHIRNAFFQHFVKWFKVEIMPEFFSRLKDKACHIQFCKLRRSHCELSSSICRIIEFVNDCFYYEEQMFLAYHCSFWCVFSQVVYPEECADRL